MLSELEKRYKYQRLFPIPSRRCNGTAFRSELMKLLFRDPIDCVYNTYLEQLSAHFNGDISNHDEWVHYCRGPDCCTSAQHSLNKARLFSVAKGCRIGVFSKIN